MSSLRCHLKHLKGKVLQNSESQGYSSLGQSLVEVAIFLPIMVVLIAGLVEISNLFVTQSRVSTAARASTGFGSTNISQSAWAESDAWGASMAIVGQNSVSADLDMTAAKWDIWTIKATTNISGDGFIEWRSVHATGDYSVITIEQWAAGEPGLQQEILDELQEDGVSSSDLQIVATVVYYFADSVLGLPVIADLAEGRPLRAISVMRVDSPTPYGEEGTGFDGGGVCDILPIAINYRNFSLYPEGFSGEPANELDPVNVYERSDWDYPDLNERPIYELGNTHAFPFNLPGVLLSDAESGYIYRAREGADENNGEDFAGNFGWLTWDGDVGQPALDASLTYPGNLSLVPPPDGPGPGLVNYVNPNDPDDYWPNTGDWVSGSTGLMNSQQVNTALRYYVNEESLFQIPAFDDVVGTGANTQYQIAGFLIAKLHTYKNQGNDNNILIEFIRWSEECLQTARLSEPTETPSSEETPTVTSTPVTPTPSSNLGSISVQKYHDQDGSGGKNAGEPGLNNWIIGLYDRNEVFLAGPLTTANHPATGEAGWVIFNNLAPGDYRVCESLQLDWVNSDPGGGSICKDVSLSGVQSSATINLSDSQGTSAAVSFVSKSGNTWTYRVNEIDGNDLEYWSLGISSCLGNVTATSPNTTLLGTDADTGFVGVRWDLSGGFTSDEFSVTLDANYPAGVGNTMVSTGSTASSGLIVAPVCNGTIDWAMTGATLGNRQEGEPTATETLPPTFTPEPSETPTVTPTDTVEPTPSPSPTSQFPCTCPPALTFDIRADGSGIRHGEYLHDQWEDWGVEFSSSSASHPPMAYDTSTLWNQDQDTGTPNQAFGGPGIGASGGPGPNQNSIPRYNILSHDLDSNDSNKPDDNGGGGNYIFTYSNPVPITSITLVDLESGQGGADIYGYLNGIPVDFRHITGLPSENGIIVETLNWTAIDRLEIAVYGSTGVASIVHCPTQTEPDPKPAVLYVTDRNYNLHPEDEAIASRLEGLGYQVSIMSTGDVRAGAANHKELVIISSRVNTSNIGSMFQNSSVPVLLWEPTLFDEMGMTSSNGAFTGNERDISIEDSSHPIAAGLSGTVDVLSNNQSMAYGSPSSGATIIAENGNRAVLFAYDAGADMANGFDAPARRVGFFLDDDSATRLTAAGWQLFDQAVYWAATTIPGPVVLPEPIPWTCEQ